MDFQKFRSLGRGVASRLATSIAGLSTGRTFMNTKILQAIPNRLIGLLLEQRELMSDLSQSGYSTSELLEVMAWIHDNAEEVVSAHSFRRDLECYGLNEALYYYSREDGLETLQACLKSPLISDDLKNEIAKQVAAKQKRVIEKEKRNLRMNRQTKLYLMRNVRNGFTKIGISNKPTARERTLQAEEPQISLLAVYDATPKDEKAMHVRYSHKRIRGEWFNLTDEDCESIATSFKQQNIAVAGKQA